MNYRGILIASLALVIFCSSGNDSFADEAKEKATITKQSSTVSPDQLEAALAPITAQLGQLHQANEILRMRLGEFEEGSSQDEILGDGIQVLRISIILMGLAMLGGMWKLRTLDRQSKN